MVEKICIICEKKFISYHELVKCCSRECSKKSRKGKPAWNKGKKYSEETKKKISKSMYEQYANGTRDPKKITQKANEHVRKFGQPKLRGITGENNHSWKGGRNITNMGYVRIRKFGGYVLEHRYVWETANGEIPDGYQIHHVNGNKKDNRLENLMIMTNSEHQTLHNKNKKRVNGSFARTDEV